MSTFSPRLKLRTFLIIETLACMNFKIFLRKTFKKLNYQSWMLYRYKLNGVELFQFEFFSSLTKFFFFLWDPQVSSNLCTIDSLSFDKTIQVIQNNKINMIKILEKT